MASSPLRVIPLLSISSPCRGILFYRYRERARRRLIIEAEFEKIAGLWLWVHFVYTCIRMFFILIYVLYKSKSLTLELLYIVGNYYDEYWFVDPSGHFTHGLLYWIVGIGYIQVMY